MPKPSDNDRVNGVGPREHLRDPEALLRHVEASERAAKTIGRRN